MKPKTLALAVSDPTSHARARLDERALTSLALDSIVVGIAETMASGQWVTGETHRQLAERHKVTLDTVTSWAADAARLLRILQRTDVDDLRARNAATLERIASVALQGGDGRTAVQAIAEANRLQGLTQTGASVAVQVNVSLEQHPEYQQLEQRIVDALEPFPEARIAVARALRSG